ncbi:MAG TPA: lipase maturation factor family protein, partial [Candidatus Angelobacter sp.]|nr:lipase maturation factor family protein [Candidatus Angelobacter sp.]
AFGSVTRERYEVVIEGTDSPTLNDQTQWQEYAFKAKPGDPGRMPPQIAAYHLRLDWLMWFLPFSVMVTGRGVHVPQYELWFLRLIQKLLENDQSTLKLLKGNPFSSGPPKFIRALFYHYRYTDWSERKQSGDWWVRRLVGVYLPPASLAQLRKL